MELIVGTACMGAGTEGTRMALRGTASWPEARLERPQPQKWGPWTLVAAGQADVGICSAQREVGRAWAPTGPWFGLSTHSL